MYQQIFQGPQSQMYMKRHTDGQGDKKTAITL
jgi:hypothetical protein